MVAVFGDVSCCLKSPHGRARIDIEEQDRVSGTNSNGQWSSKHRVQRLVYKHICAPLDHLTLLHFPTLMRDRMLIDCNSRSLSGQFQLGGVRNA